MPLYLAMAESRHHRSPVSSRCTNVFHSASTTLDAQCMGRTRHGGGGEEGRRSGRDAPTCKKGNDLSKDPQAASPRLLERASRLPVADHSLRAHLAGGVPLLTTGGLMSVGQPAFDRQLETAALQHEGGNHLVAESRSRPLELRSHSDYSHPQPLRDRMYNCNTHKGQDTAFFVHSGVQL